jgi:hypothetical protein
MQERTPFFIKYTFLLCPADVQVLQMQESDVLACDSLFERAMGFRRETEIRNDLAYQPTNAWVAKKRDDDSVL